MTKVYMRKGSTPEHRLAISDSIHRSLIEVLGIPEDDRYHIFHELEAENLITVPIAFGLERRAEAVFVQLYFGARPAEQLKELYRVLVADLVGHTSLERRDIYINVVESPSANWWADGRVLSPTTGFDERMEADEVPTVSTTLSISRPVDGDGRRVVSAPEPDDLGGRLGLLVPADLDDAQREIYNALTKIVVPEAAEHGYTARLDDGRFVGPFNALLRVPAIAMGMGAWTSRIDASHMAADVRQVVILTVAAAWSADFEIDAHSSAARTAGIPEAAIDGIVRQEPPAGLSHDADIAHRVTRHLLAYQGVPDAIYHEAIAAFGESGLVTILCLIGQYQTISSILVCFEVPVPVAPGDDGTDTASTSEEKR